MASSTGGLLPRLAGVTLVGGLTYAGEYIAYLIILVWIQDKLVVQFQFGTYSIFIVGVIAGAYLIVSGLLAIPFGHLTDRYGRRLFAILGSLIGGVSLLALLGVGAITDPTAFLVAIGIILVTLGFGHATYTASTWAYVGDIAREQNLGKSYGLLEIAEYGAFAFGPGVGIFIANAWGREPTFARKSAIQSIIWCPYCRNSSGGISPRSCGAVPVEESLFIFLAGPHKQPENCARSGS